MIRTRVTKRETDGRTDFTRLSFFKALLMVARWKLWRRTPVEMSSEMSDRSLERRKCNQWSLVGNFVNMCK